MGEVFAGRYELCDPIGRGGVGAVWRAWDHRRRRYVAAKVLQQSDAHSLLRFVREQALRIDHPHVLAPASWAADDDKVLFTMDLVAGGSLVHLVGDYGPLPPAVVVTLLDQLLSGLAAVHAEGVVHRDIKPANVLLEATGTARPRLRLSDFGIAMRLGEPRLTETDYVVGTPGYLAPEQLLGAEPDFAADLFAVGLVALYLLEGAKPDTKALVEYFVAHGTPGAPRGVPAPLWEVVATLLQPDPAARFRSATGARKALATAGELLPGPGPDDERVEIFDQVGPLPEGFGPDGPLRTASGITVSVPSRTPATDTMTGGGARRSASAERSGAPKPSPACGPGTDGGAARSAPGAIPPRPTTAPTTPASGTATPAPAASSSVTGTPASVAPGDGAPPSAATDAATPAPAASSSVTGTPASVAPGDGAPPSAATDAATPAPAASSSVTGPSASVAPGDGAPPVAQAPSPPVARLGSAPLVVPPRPAADPTPPGRPPTMSDTGSFHLPPPLPREALRPAPRPPQRPPAATVLPASAPMTPVRGTHHDPTYVPTAGPSAAPALAVRHYAGAGASLDTATRPGQPVRHARKAARRPGPPVKVAVPVLLLALVCFAVGFWALTRI